MPPSPTQNLNVTRTDREETTRLFGLDLLRAAAILLVLTAHTLPGGSTFPIIPTIASVSGYLGVELFFVLSGFLIGGILIRMLQRGELGTFAGVWEFWKRRWFRTVPNYAIFLVFNLAWAAKFGSVSIVSYWNYLFFSQNLGWPCPIFFQESWSLAVEEWFYLVFPVFVVGFTVWNRKPSRFGLVLLLMLILPFGLRCLGWIEGSWDETIRKVVIYRLDSMMIGVAAAYLATTHAHWWKKAERLWPVGIILLLGVAIHLIRFQPLDSTFWYNRALPTLLTSFATALLLPALVTIRTQNHCFAKTVRHISLWSYSLYLCHTPVIRLLQYVCTEIIPFAPYKNPIIRCLLIWVIAFATAALIYRLWEKPMTQLRDRKPAATGTPPR